jgi:hypothetical protein
MSTTIKCDVPIQAGFDKACTAVFNSAGLLLIVEGMELGAEEPDEFYVEIEGSQFGVRREGGEHVVSADLREAFIAMVFG